MGEFMSSGISRTGVSGVSPWLHVRFDWKLSKQFAFPLQSCSLWSQTSSHQRETTPGAEHLLNNL